MHSDSQLEKYCRLMYQRDMVSSTGGNVSVRLEDSILISPTASVLADLDTPDFVEVSLDGKVLSSSGTPSKELPFHLAIYRSRPNIGAVLHGHSPYAVVASTLLEPDSFDAFPVYTAGYVSRVTRLPLLPYFDSGSAELSDAVAETFAAGAKAALLQNHGFIAVGPELRGAFVTADELMDAVKAFVLSHGTAQPLNMEAQDRLLAKATVGAAARTLR
jgi:ribulose-5-phosphate 4-epimerase/fuculose-1-phosphate aldolase